MGKTTHDRTNNNWCGLYNHAVRVTTRFHPRRNCTHTGTNGTGRMVKLGWFDCPEGSERFVMRDIIQLVRSQFIGAPSPSLVLLGVQILKQLVEEMNVAVAAHVLTRHRKVMTSFRDKSLFPIFELALGMVSRLIVTGRFGRQPLNRWEWNRPPTAHMFLQITINCSPLHRLLPST
jgi:hypothetical protein